MNDCCHYNDAVGGGTSRNPDHSDSYMSNSTLDEHGSVTTTTSNLKAWVMGNDGTWVQSSQTIGYSGSGGKGSTYTFNNATAGMAIPVSTDGNGSAQTMLILKYRRERFAPGSKPPANQTLTPH